MATEVQPPFASVTPTWHNTSYPSISPKRPELSAKGKSIFITGGGTGIGAAIAYSFATAGAREFTLAGRTQATLSASADRLRTDFPDAKVLTLITDVVKQDDVDAAFAQTIKEFGRVDICISNAGYSLSPSPVSAIDESEWKKAFDINVHGSFYVAKAFLKNAKEGSFLINTSTGIAHMPAWGNIAAYAASKLAAVKMFEYIALENPGINVFNVQPGVVGATGVSQQAMQGTTLDIDDVELAGDFYVWLVSPDAAFLKGKFVWVNW